MTTSQQSDLALLQDEATWAGGPTWDLEFNVALPHSVEAVMSLLQCSRLRGWWQRQDSIVATAPTDRDAIQDRLNDESGWMQAIGFARVEANRELPCSVVASIMHENDRIPRPAGVNAARGAPAYALLYLFIPAGGLRRFFPDSDTGCFGVFAPPASWDVPWVKQLSAFFKSVATEVLSACDAELAWFGMEGASFDAATITENDLYSPYNGVYLPTRHPLSSAHGGVEVSVGAGYRLWGLGVESPGRRE